MLLVTKVNLFSTIAYPIRSTAFRVALTRRLLTGHDCASMSTWIQHLTFDDSNHTTIMQIRDNRSTVVSPCFTL
jgi:hypothetical protein